MDTFTIKILSSTIESAMKYNENQRIITTPQIPQGGGEPSPWWGGGGGGPRALHHIYIYIYTYLYTCYVYNVNDINIRVAHRIHWVCDIAMYTRTIIYFTNVK